jgi:hypothetical protein
VLATLLPGLRAVRAPLAAGYLWLLGLWLIVAPHLHPADDPDGVVAEIDRLGHAGGRAAVAIAVSIAAYLVGVVSIAANPVLNRIGNPLAATPLRALMPRALWGRVDGSLAALVRARIGERFDADPAIRQDTAQALRAAQSAAGPDLPALPAMFSGDPGDVIERARASATVRGRLLPGLVDVRPIEKACFAELMLAPLRIVGHDADLYQIYDLYQAEHDLRLGLVLPLAFLTATLSVLASPWWAFGAVAAAIMLYLGVAANIEATTVLTGSIDVRRLDLPTLDGLTSAPLPWRDPADARRALAR